MVFGLQLAARLASVRKQELGIRYKAQNRERYTVRLGVPCCLVECDLLRTHDILQLLVMLADTGYCSAANVQACEARQIEPMLAMKRQTHHLPVLERLAAYSSAPESDDPVLKTAHQLGTKAGRILYGLRKQTVEPVFEIIKDVMGWRQMSMGGLERPKANGHW